jgi:hypothetical protein
MVRYDFGFRLYVIGFKMTHYRTGRSVSSESDTHGSRVHPAVLDSSAILDWLLREPGGELVEAGLPSFVSAVNLTEVVHVAARCGLDIEEVRRVVVELP